MKIVLSRRAVLIAEDAALLHEHMCWIRYNTKWSLRSVGVRFGGWFVGLILGDNANIASVI